MPEAYTHLRIARAALVAARMSVPCQNAYETGAQGPDPLLAAHALGRRKSDLPALARRMHTQDCGAFLVLLLQNATTPAQRSYALGFLMHYAADTTLHPYVLALSAPGAVYERAFGHGFCEAALDSFFYQADNGKTAVPVHDAAPALHTKQLAEVCALLKKTVRAVYGLDVPALDFADAFHLFRLGHKHTASPHGGKKLLARAADAVLRKKGCLLSHTTPQKPPKDGFPKEWTHLETGEAQTSGPHALCMQAVHQGAKHLVAASELWQQKITPAQCWRRLGSNSYFTGLPCKKEPVEKKKVPDGEMAANRTGCNESPPADESAVKRAAGNESPRAGETTANRTTGNESSQPAAPGAQTPESEKQNAQAAPSSSPARQQAAAAATPAGQASL